MYVALTQKLSQTPLLHVSHGTLKKPFTHWILPHGVSHIDDSDDEHAHETSLHPLYWQAAFDVQA